MQGDGVSVLGGAGGDEGVVVQMDGFAGLEAGEEVGEVVLDPGEVHLVEDGEERERGPTGALGLAVLVGGSEQEF